MDGLNALRNPHLKRFFQDNFKTTAPVDAVAGSVTLGLSTSVCTLTSDIKGTYGNGFSVSIVSGTETASDLVVAYDPKTMAITITPARSGGADTTTGALLATAINALADLDGIVTASAGGVGVMAEAASTAFTGGVNGTPGIGGFTRCIDATHVYFCTSDATVNTSGKWRRIAHSALA